MRKLALDLGSKTCGFALSDSLNIIAQGLTNLHFEERNWKAVIAQVQKYLIAYKIDVIVIGYPTYPSGDKSPTSFMIEEFAMLLQSKVKQKIVFIDENFSTKQAHATMIKAGLSRKKRKQYKDKLAAQLILQDYLAKVKL